MWADYGKLGLAKSPHTIFTSHKNQDIDKHINDVDIFKITYFLCECRVLDLINFNEFVSITKYEYEILNN